MVVGSSPSIPAIMENIELNTVFKLHEQTGKSLISCKVALQNSDTFEEAIDYLNKRGIELVYGSYIQT